MNGLTPTRPELDLRQYREALGSFLTGVTIVTTIDEEGRDRGMTANSFTSVSLDPPLVLVCIDKRASSYGAFATAAGYAVHILGAEQLDLAKRFASKSPDKFDGLELRRSSVGVPLLSDAHAVLACTVHTVVDAGDHAVLIGEVEGFERNDRRPLGFYQGKLQSFTAEEEVAALAQARGAELRVLWVLETVDGALILRRTDGGHRLPESSVPPAELEAGALSDAASAALDAPVIIDFLYSMYGTPADGLTLVYRGRVDPTGTGTLRREGLSAVAADDAIDLLQDPGEKAVAERYVNERGDASFGIYAGSIELGAVAPVHAPISQVD